MRVVDKSYQEHRVFSEFSKYVEFYKHFSMSVFSFVSMGTKAFGNIDTYMYSSIQGTIKSIEAVLRAGRINDAYALLRKYHDSVVINVYSTLYLHDHLSIENFVVEKINNWLQAKESLPEFRVMSQYIKASPALKPINDILNIDDRYKKLRSRCNDHMHYNFYRHVMLNDSEIHIDNRGEWLDRLSRDALDLFVLHLGYVFFLNGHYMMSSDHLDALECGMQPEGDSQYWVAPYIQEIFDNIITPHRPDITATIKEWTTMQLS
ncbi:hypothetical protein SAMN05216334_13316 [Nitrosomonas ureae]|uniref:Uncharacterized protein n=2 Tax=Nitrosomonas ureae TaxID=44577 RepID=A0A1H5XX51_9PROT|nr:hypothetical protein SAMN05216334_13316 [Nitrosomonas ureae]